ncbi:MAG: hypothetical protein ACLR3R_04195 [Clostridium paraputrificum]
MSRHTIITLLSSLINQAILLVTVMTVYPISGSVNADEDIFRLTGPIESAKNNALLELQQQEPSSTQHR